MGHHKLGFTLIELFLTLAILAFLSALLLFNSKPMLDHYRFSKGCKKLEREISFSKRIAQTASTYIEVVLEQKGNQLMCTRKTDEPLTLKGVVHCPVIIPSVYLEKNEMQTILITSSGWVEKDYEIKISLGKQSKTIDARKDIE